MMPPKDFIKWDGMRVFIRDADGNYTEFGELNVNPVLEPIESVEVKTYTLEPMVFSLQFSSRFRSRVRLLQVLGYLKSPKLTYKTNMEYIKKRRYNGHRRPKKH